MNATYPEIEASHEHCSHCFHTLKTKLDGTELLALSPSFCNHRCPLFVTWTKRVDDGEDMLRGCIGTLEPKYIHTALSEYAVISALKDRRFRPISHAELQHLTCTVSLLKDFEEAKHYLDWEIGVHGIILEFYDGKGYQYSATYLPEVAEQQRWDKEECIESLVRKSGYQGHVTAKLKSTLKITRYQSTLCSMTYKEYEMTLNVTASNDGHVNGKNGTCFISKT